MDKKQPKLPDCANCSIVNNLKTAIKISEEIKELKEEIALTQKKLPICANKIHPN